MQNKVLTLKTLSSQGHFKKLSFHLPLFFSFAENYDWDISKRPKPNNLLQCHKVV